ncbi:MAG TPA: NAD(P)-dependent oxidoreductase [Kiritimatiellia bacterium]|nr:NAD(P)-dependent oxidoreductase [Kiritimatiellia bacterium]HMO98673.1 NAD(P)-dependent oxidoreductase [Kiritimatiellia bacterium]HMP90833.1 NAD(P)-dependent oxidoreductase [Kiritimatiellia bacterium]
MNIIVTGSEGFLGRKLVDRLADSGRSIIAVDRLFHSGSSHDNVTHHQSDLEDPSRLVPASIKPDTPFVLIHLAWDMRRYQGFGIQAGQIDQFAKLLDYWSERGLQRLIMMGSAEEYGHRAGRLLESDMPELPLSPYGWAKRAARDLAASWCIRTGIPVVWLRPFIMYGPGQRGDMMIPFALESARLKRRAHMTDGRQQRDFVYIDDVVEAIAMAVAQNASGYQEFNLGCGEGVKVADVVMAIAGHYGVEDLFELGARPRRPGEPDVQIADCTKAAALLGWKATVGWREGIDRTLLEARD